MPPGTLPPVVLPYDPTSVTPVCLVALDSADPGRGGPVRRRAVRGSAADHVAARGTRAAGLWRQGPRGHDVPRSRQAAGAAPLADGRDEGRRRIQRLPAHRQCQVRHDRLCHRQQFDVRRRRADGGYPAAQRAWQRHVPARRGDPQGRQLHPDQRGAGQRQAPGLYPGLPPARLEHARRGRTISRGRSTRSRRD